MKNKQTAVEFLLRELRIEDLAKGEQLSIVLEICKQAKEIEKQMVIDIVEKSRATGLTAEYLLLTYGNDEILKEYHIVDTNEMVLPQVEISDEEIYKEAEHKSKIFRGWTIAETSVWVMACQWYREQIKEAKEMEIPDNEIWQKSAEWNNIEYNKFTKSLAFFEGAKWYREKIKK